MNPLSPFLEKIQDNGADAANGWNWSGFEIQRGKC